MRALLVGLMAAMLGQAAQSLSLSATNGSATGTVLSTGVWSSATLSGSSMRFEARIHGITSPASGNPRSIIAVNTDNTNGHMFLLSLTSATDATGRTVNAICAEFPFMDSSVQGIYKCISVVGRTDVLVRVTRDVPNLVRRIEMWDTATGGNYSVSDPNWVITTLGSVTSGLPISVGGLPRFSDTAWTGTDAASVAWFKWQNTALPAASAPPKAADSAALGNWLFEGNGNDQNSNITFSVSAPATYITTPPLPPICTPRTLGYESTTTPVWTNWIAMRAGVQGQMDATSSSTDEIGALTYLWAGSSTDASTLAWSSRTASQPYITGLVAGTYNARLTCTAPSGLNATTVLQYGAVAMDDNGVVINADTDMDKIIGPQIAFGRSPWPTMDYWAKWNADFFGARLATGQAQAPVWKTRTPKTGTVAWSSGSTTLTGTGTLFLSELACNNTQFITMRRPDGANLNGDGIQYQNYVINSCASDTVATLSYPMGDSASGIPFTTMSESEMGQWGGEYNYYDNVLAHYSFYRRSGNTAYRDYARTLADNWFGAPFMDYFRGGGTGFFGQPRQVGLSGTVLRALDGKPEWWPYIQTRMDTSDTRFNLTFNYSTTTNDFDAREDWYQLADVALGAGWYYNSNAGTQATKRAQYAATLMVAKTNWWANLRGSNNEWLMSYNGGYASASTATVTNGSTTVTGTFTATACNQIDIGGGNLVPAIIYFTSANNFTGDTRGYKCTYVNGTTLSLDAVYAGTSGTKKYIIGSIGGAWAQPFMQGVATRSQWLAYQATGDTTYKGYIKPTVDYLRSVGYWSTYRGLYYLTTAYPCSVPADQISILICTNQGDGTGANVEYAIETMNAFSFAALTDPTTANTTQGDLHAGAIFATLGGPQAYGSGASSPSPTTQTTNPRGKYNGFTFGVGGAATWPAARVGGVAAITNSTKSIKARLADVTNATDIVVDFQAADGTVSTSSPCTSAACTFSVDNRQNYRYRVRYRKSSGTVVVGTGLYAPVQ